MLEKLAGNINAQKLRAILFPEVDFNGMCKIIFDNRLISEIEATNIIPEEVIEDWRSQVATHLMLNKN